MHRTRPPAVCSLRPAAHRRPGAFPAAGGRASGAGGPSSAPESAYQVAQIIAEPGPVQLYPAPCRFPADLRGKLEGQKAAAQLQALDHRGTVRGIDPAETESLPMKWRSGIRHCHPVLQCCDDVFDAGVRSGETGTGMKRRTMQGCRLLCLPPDPLFPGLGHHGTEAAQKTAAHSEDKKQGAQGQPAQ